MSELPEPPSESNETSSLWRSPYTWAVLACLIIIPAMRPLLRFEPPPPPPLFSLPAFELLDSAGQPFGSEQLSGRVYIANFIFTRCQTACPVLTRSMHELRDRFDDNEIEDVHFISVTVDPRYDTPERLAAYAREHDIDTRRWSLLSGAPEAIAALVRDGFKVPVGETTRNEQGLVDIAHSGQLVLVDRFGQVRGFYGIDALGLDEIFHRAQHVLEDQTGPAEL